MTTKRNGAAAPDDDEPRPPLTERALMVQTIGEAGAALESAGRALTSVAMILTRAGAAPPAPRPRPEPDAVFTMGGK